MVSLQLLPFLSYFGITSREGGVYAPRLGFKYNIYLHMTISEKYQILLTQLFIFFCRIKITVISWIPTISS